jgi:hypothetical protein
MAERLEDLLRECTVQVIGERSQGAGFFVAPGKVMTCVHVIHDNPVLIVQWERDGQDPVEFQVVGAPVRLAARGRAIAALEAEYPDLAMLDLAEADGHPCVRLAAEWPEDEDTFQVYGYPKEGGTVRLTPARLAYRGKHGNEPTAYLDLASDTVKPGMSGGAVLNRRTGLVCGVIVASKNAARPDGALAVPFQAVAAELGDLLAANGAFHGEDARWRAAVAPLSTAVPGAVVPGKTVFPGKTVVPGKAVPGKAPSVEVIIEVALAGTGTLDACVRMSGTVLCRQQAPLPAEVIEVWKALDLPALIAGERMADAGRRTPARACASR